MITQIYLLDPTPSNLKCERCASNNLLVFVDERRRIVLIICKDCRRMQTHEDS